MTYQLLDLFSGIGGFSLGLERSGAFRTVAFCEIEAFPRKVLAKHWPKVPIYDDVRNLNAKRLIVDGIVVTAICGGFPCQDISSAGQRAGLAGERSGLWAEYARLIREIRPSIVIVENVPSLLVRGMGAVLGDLADAGYDADWFGIPAAAVHSPQYRARQWVVAFPSGERDRPPIDPFQARRGDVGFCAEWPAEPDVRRVAHGVPNRVDRLRGLGNAVVPQIPELIGRAILAAEGR